MSNTITQTLSSSQAQQTIRLSRSPLDTINILFQEIYDSNIFSSEETLSLQQIQLQLSSFEDPNDILNGLCFVLFNYLRPKIQSDLTRAETLLYLEDELQKCLKIWLPEHIDIAAYIITKSDELLAIDQLVMLQDSINRIFEQIETLTTSSNEILLRYFEEMREKFNVIRKNLQTHQQDFFQRVEKQMKALELLISNAKTETSNAQSIGDKLYQENLNLKNIIKRDR